MAIPSKDKIKKTMKLAHTQGTMFIDSTGTTTNIETYGHPYLIDTIVGCDSIDLIYQQDPMMTYTSTTMYFEEIQLEPIIYKVVYSCKDGKWHVSEPIHGEYVPAANETYKFD